MAPTLGGIRIVSTALNIPGPVAAGTLGDMGASVVKVEPPSGDPLALGAPSWYSALSSGMEVLRVDLKSPDGRQRLASFLEIADLFITATRPASLDRLGLSWPDLHRAHPRLCHVAIVGHESPREHVPGHDLTYQAAAGLLAGRAMPRTLVADLAGAQQVVSAALELLLARERGQGAMMRIVSLEAAAGLFAEPLRHGLTARGGLLGGALPTYRIYPTADGWIAIAALEPHFRDALARELQIDVSDSDALTKALSAKSAIDWERWAEARELPIAAFRSALR